MVNGISLVQTDMPTLGNMKLPNLIVDDGEMTTRRFVEFFTAQIRNKGTRAAYGHAVFDFFDWCNSLAIGLQQIEPIVVASYIEEISKHLAPPTVKLRLAAIRMLFDYLVTGQVVPFNPAAAVRGPRHVVKKSKTPVLSAELTRELLDSIDVNTIAGLRDRALIGVMVFSFARVSAAISMDVKDYHQQGRRMWFRLLEKGGKPHDVPAHHLAENYLDQYLDAVEDDFDPSSPLFRTLGANKQLTDRRMSRTDALRMVKRRAVAIGLPSDICCHTWRATGITTYLQNGGSLEHAMAMLGESNEPTKAKLCRCLVAAGPRAVAGSVNALRNASEIGRLLLMGVLSDICADWPEEIAKQYALIEADEQVQESLPFILAGAQQISSKFDHWLTSSLASSSVEKQSLALFALSNVADVSPDVVRSIVTVFLTSDYLVHEKAKAILVRLGRIVHNQIQLADIEMGNRELERLEQLKQALGIVGSNASTKDDIVLRRLGQSDLVRLFVSVAEIIDREGRASFPTIEKALRKPASTIRMQLAKFSDLLGKELGQEEGIALIGGETKRARVLTEEGMFWFSRCREYLNVIDS